ncbi:RDD family protein [Labilibacter sediminis]|nr:RDD family protein [Labilibacter sediminis]
MEVEANIEEKAPVKTQKGPLGSRIAAFIIDFIVLGIIGLILGLIFKSFFVQLAWHGVLVGWIITTIYFTCGNSIIFKGSTIGKEFMGIKVVDYKSQYLTPFFAIKRSLLFTTPYFLLEYFQSFFDHYYLSILLSIITLSYYIGLVYFLLVNKISKQSIHDILAKTVVVNKTNEDSCKPRSITQSKIIGFVSIVIVLWGAMFSVGYSFVDSSNLQEVFDENKETLFEIASELTENEQVLFVEKTQINITIESEVGIIVELTTSKDFDDIDEERFKEEVFDVIKRKCFNLQRIDYAEVIMNYGYDIGIWSTNYSKTWTIRN